MKRGKMEKEKKGKKKKNYLGEKLIKIFSRKLYRIFNRFYEEKFMKKKVFCGPFYFSSLLEA